MISSAETLEPHAPAATMTLHQLLLDRARENAEQGAILAPERRPLTYARLLHHVERTVDALRAGGLSRNDRVALVLPNGPELATAFISVAAGAACAPLNPAYREAEFDFYLSDLKAKALIIQAGMDSPARDIARQRGISIIELVSERDEPAGVFTLTGAPKVSRAPDAYAEAGDVALVLHTSGTTARPKIVPLTHANVCSSGRHIAATLELTPSDTCLNVMPLFHIHGLIGAVVSSLTACAGVVCTPGFEAERFFELIDRLDPTWYTAVPTMHQAILGRTAANRDVIARHPLRFIRSSSAAAGRSGGGIRDKGRRIVRDD
jgi:acyl-CoA synthetase (AMP-forming)/AMP-acid ligase II